MNSFAPAPATRVRNVLIVEDHPDSRESLRRLVQYLGHRTETAGDGLEGVAAGLAHRPDVVVVDIGLPGIDGYEVARRLRAGLGDGVFLIAYTAYGQPEDRARAVGAGFNLFLVKPEGLSELLRVLGAAR